jgi:hypothetical protein
MSVRLTQEGYRILITIFLPTCNRSVTIHHAKTLRRKSDGATGDKITSPLLALSIYRPVAPSPRLLINLGPTQQPMAAISIPAKTSTT